jgi:hypothetical protein
MERRALRTSANEQLSFAAAQHTTAHSTTPPDVMCLSNPLDGVDNVILIKAVM